MRILTVVSEIKIMNPLKILLLLLLSSVFYHNALAAGLEAKQCKRLKIGQVGWSDEQVLIAATEIVLEKLGYRVTKTLDTQPKVLKSLSQGGQDVFMATWLPSSSALIDPYLKEGTIEKLSVNLTGAKYTLAVPAYVYEQGVKTMSDLAKHKDKFKGLIFGLERGNDGNLLIKDMIKKNHDGMGVFKMMPTSERIMLAQVRKNIRKNTWIIFLGWQPHAMNVQFDIKYLDGGDDFFGPNQGASTVHTVVRKGFKQQCPNAAKLLANMTFPIAAMNDILLDIQENLVEPYTATLNWIRNNPSQLKNWLKGVRAIQPKVDADISSYITK